METNIGFIVLLSTALFLDILLGDPKCLPHPVVGVGKAINFWESHLYPSTGTINGKRRGVMLSIAVILTACLTACLILALSYYNKYLYFAVQAYGLYAAIAWRSLKDETLPIAIALFRKDISTAQNSLSRVVGRDTKQLDEPGIVRAVVETISENSVDGIFSVIFFALLGYILLGGAGAVIFAWLFKAVSTLDSMVGYDNDRYHYFGWSSAKLDDVLNFIPARIGGLVILASGLCLGYKFSRGVRIFFRDRMKHKSPNSAHGESAYAGLMGIRLGGGAFYNGVFEEKPWLGDDVRAAEAEDILKAHLILDASLALFTLLAMIISMI